MIVRTIIRTTVTWIGILYLNPTGTMLLISLLWQRNRSWLGVGWAIAGLGFDLSICVLSDFSLTSLRTQALLSVLKKFEGYRLETVPLEGLLPDEALGEIFRGVYEPEKRWRFLENAPKMWSQVRAFAVIPGPNQDALGVPTALQDLDGYCTIFVPDRAEDMTGYQRFLVLHELGHATRKNAFQLSRVAAKPVFSFFCGWCLFRGVHSGPAALGATVALLVAQGWVRMGFKDSPANMARMALYNELAADHFAVTWAKKSDLERIRGILEKATIEDRRLSVESDRRRKETLVENVRRRLADEELIEPPIRNFPPVPLYLAHLLTLAGLAYVGHSGSAWLLLCVIGIVLVTYFVAANVAAYNEHDLRKAANLRLDELKVEGRVEVS